MPDHRSPAELSSAAVHDVRGSVGSIRLAVTSVLADGDDDAEFRQMMLTTIETETRRLDAALSGLQALTDALTDSEQPERVDLGEALRQAAAQAARRQVATDVESLDAMTVTARPAALRAVIAALLGIAADGAGSVILAAKERENDVVLRIARGDATAVASERALVRSLLAALDAEATPDVDALEFRLPR